MASNSGRRLGRSHCKPQTLDALLQKMRQASILCDADGRLLFASPAALLCLADRDALTLEDGMLGSPYTDSLRATISRACDAANPRAQTVMLPGSTGPSILLSVAPVRDADGRSLALLLLRKSFDLHAEILEPLQALFGLSRAEAEIAVAISNGASLQEIASVRGSSIATIRFQLKSIAGKLGCSRQAEIASLVNTIAQSNGAV